MIMTPTMLISGPATILQKKQAAYPAAVDDDLEDEGYVDDPEEAAELERVALMFGALGQNCLEEPEKCANFLQEASVAFAFSSEGKG